SEKQGWIDMGHFFTAADLARTMSAVPDVSIGLINAGGYWIEQTQGISYYIPYASEYAYGSYETYEDYPSNVAGSVFGADFDPKRPVSVQLGEFFRKIQTMNDPKKNPKSGYKALPKTEEEHYAKRKREREDRVKYSADTWAILVSLFEYGKVIH
ncbi:MAG: hypothetical protein AAB425_03295, partial [Bdellovibrionota bacterium]